MIIITVEIEIRGEDESVSNVNRIVKNIESNLNSTMGHCPYDAEVSDISYKVDEGQNSED